MNTTANEHQYMENLMTWSEIVKTLWAEPLRNSKGIDSHTWGNKCEAYEPGCKDKELVSVLIYAKLNKAGTAHYSSTEPGEPVDPGNRSLLGHGGDGCESATSNSRRYPKVPPELVLLADEAIVERADYGARGNRQNANIIKFLEELEVTFRGAT